MLEIKEGQKEQSNEVQKVEKAPPEENGVPPDGEKDIKQNVEVSKVQSEEKTPENEILPKDMDVNKKSKKKLIILIIAVILVIAILSIMFALINMANNKIIKGVFVGSVDVSNLSKEEAMAVLNDIYTKRAEEKIYLTHGEFETTITYDAIEAKYQIEKAVEDAYGVGRNDNIFMNNINILKSLINGYEVNLEVTLDSDMISQVVKNINNGLQGAVVQPSYYIEEDKLIITSGKEGIKVDEKQLLEQIYNVLDAKVDSEQKINIPVINAKPEEIDIEKIHKEIYKEVKDAYYTTNPFTVYPEEKGIDFDIEAAKTQLQEDKEQYEIQLNITNPAKTVQEIGTEAFPDLLGTCTTKYNAGDRDRTTNLKLAANKINGTVLLPNEEFSYNKTVGERTKAAGFKDAATFSNGKVVDGIGGGICQISSTLYDAIIYANLDVTTRRNHQFVTSYVPAGYDATVVWGSQDFKFVNSRKNPVRITATVEGGVATVKVWGIKEEVEYDIKIETKKVSAIPHDTQYIQDSSLPAGKEEVVQKGKDGSRVEAYKVSSLNGKVVSRTLLSRDTYNAMKEIIHIGTGQ